MGHAMEKKIWYIRARIFIYKYIQKYRPHPYLIRFNWVLRIAYWANIVKKSLTLEQYSAVRIHS